MTSNTHVITKKVFAEDQKVEKQQKKKPQTLVIRLQQKPQPRVSWTQDTIDNEFMNKKKSNLCCIYHKPGQSSSDTCTSDDEGNALQRDKHTKHLHKKVCSKLNNKRKQQQKKESKNHSGDKCCK